MILSGKEIERRTHESYSMSMGEYFTDIVIRPFDPKCLNPNSYNVHLGNQLVALRPNVFMGYDKEGRRLHGLDMAAEPQGEYFTIGEEGFVLLPGQLYLAQTQEYTETRNLVPMLEGRSSVGRLGMFVHVTAGFGDVGFCGHWTLELMVVHPLRIYAGVEIAQVFYHTVVGETTEYAQNAKYNHNAGVQMSKLWKEFME